MFFAQIDIAFIVPKELGKLVSDTESVVRAVWDLV